MAQLGPCHNEEKNSMDLEQGPHSVPAAAVYNGRTISRHHNDDDDDDEGDSSHLSAATTRRTVSLRCQSLEDKTDQGRRSATVRRTVSLRRHLPVSYTHLTLPTNREV